MSLRAAALIALLPITAASAAPPLTVPQCTGVRLQAAYLADARPQPGEPEVRSAGDKVGGPGFYVTLVNNTNQPIEVAEPFPSSAHWYAETPGGRLLWRASSGGGGALVDALNPRGRLFASPVGPTAVHVRVAAHSQLSWAEPIASHPALDFRPGCQHCSNPGEHSFRAVLAYALLPPAAGGGLLPCGLRSDPFIMPPLQ